MGETWTEGWLRDGTHFHIDRDPYLGNGTLRINGAPVRLVGQHPVQRRRDGGTTIITAEQGRYVAHRQIGREPFDTWNGVRLLGEPEPFDPEEPGAA